MSSFFKIRDKVHGITSRYFHVYMVKDVAIVYMHLGMLYVCVTFIHGDPVLKNMYFDFFTFKTHFIIHFEYL